MNDKNSKVSIIEGWTHDMKNLPTSDIDDGTVFIEYPTKKTYVFEKKKGKWTLFY